MELDIAFTIFTLLAVVSVVLFGTVITKDLQMLQQNSYRNERYTRWITSSGDTLSVRRLLNAALFILIISLFARSIFVIGIVIAVMIAECIVLMARKSKKPLVFTKRVWRLFITINVLTWVLAALVAAFYNAPHHPIHTFATVMMLATPLSSAIVIAANWLLKPVEKSINNHYVDDARRILAQKPDMIIVGITGSYGKTSTKHYLNRILSEKYSVLMTPGSYNTPMGVVRTIREMLQPYNNLFIVEMGAKNIGDIKEICDIVHPTFGIITAVGEQHLESFKTIENVQRTKFELIDALPADGFGVLNNDFPYIANRPVDNVETCRYTVKRESGSDYHAEDIAYSARGTTFKIVGRGKSLELSTRLVGECNISNLMAAVIMAMRLGVPDNKIQYAVSKIEQVEHRLNVKRTPAGITIIDDAFNSNPDGSGMALDVLAGMTGGKRIVITPGMIELGSKQEHYNELFGEHIAETCDVAIIVGEYNREAILNGIKRKRSDKLIVHTVPTFAEAQKKMLEMAKAGDTVLYENDLPDTFK